MSLFSHHFLVTQFPSLITHNSKYQDCLVSSLTSHHLIFFTLFVGPISVTGAAFSFLFSSVPKLIEPSEKKRKEKKNRPNQWKKKRKKKKKPRTDRTANPGEKRKEKKKKKKEQIEPVEKKKRKEETQNRPNSQLRRKKKNRTANPDKKGKKKSKVKSCGWILFVGPLCVFNYNIAIELWVIEIENSQNVFSVSITHNSKIRELGDGNRVIVCQTTFLS